MSDPIKTVLGQLIGVPVDSLSPLSGGDINEAFLAILSDGRQVFAKCNQRAPHAMFETEARGLAWLGEAGALKLPEVLAVSRADSGELPMLVLEYLEAGRPGPKFEEELGRGLAQLHRSGAEGFGLDHDNFIGTLPQDNTPEKTWPNFYRERRLRPQLKRAVDAGLAPTRLARRFEDLFGRLEELVGPTEAPCRLHGDLWGGNLHCTQGGTPALIDPAAYAGHREVDLAMMQLFGGVGSRVFRAYHEEFPVAPGHGERRSLYQLYPLMVHLNLFGSGYLGAVERALGVYL